jgi:C-terminal processing protease CtpA/Prc
MSPSRVFGAILALISVPILAAQDRTDTAPIERLEGLCKLWGTAKFFHPSLADDAIDWDKALVETIPLVDKAETPEAYRLAIDHLLSALNDPASKTLALSNEPKGAGNRSGPPALEWIKDGDANIALISARDWTAITEMPSAANGGAFASLFAKCGSATAIILDLRRSSAAPHADADGEAWTVSRALKTDVPALTGGTLTLPAWRSRMHSGYAPQTGQTSGGYYSGYQVTEHAAAKAEPVVPAGTPVIILTGPTSRMLTETLAAMQASGAAMVIHEGEPGETFASGDSCDITLPMNVRVRIRTAELVNSDGTLGFGPAMTVASTDDAAMAAAKEAARTGAIQGAPTRSRAVSATKSYDKPYASMAYPSREYRLLGLFRLWTVIHYFFPYQEHMDAPWEGTLREFIPRFAEAKDAAEYGLAIREMIARLQDTHVNASGGEAIAQARERLGGYAPPVAVLPIGGKPVILKVLDEEGTEGARDGDTILTIDGEDVEAVRAKFARYIANSTMQSMRRRVDIELLRGPKDTAVRLEVEGVDGARRTITLKRVEQSERVMREAYAKAGQHPPHETFCVLPEGYGYFDLVALTQGQVGAAFEKVKDTPALIMDMRGYPKGTAWAICSRLTDKRMTMARFSRAYLTTPDPDEHTSYGFDQIIQPSPLWKYTGKIVVLIDDRAISQSEHSCLGFEEAAKGRIAFVGSPTTGANGDVTNCVLPGGIRVGFSGHDVRHADGRQLQRIGITPDIAVEPTVKGLLEGKDEVLDAAVQHLRTP